MSEFKILCRECGEPCVHCCPADGQECRCESCRVGYSVGPDDALVLSVKGRLSDQQAARIKEQFSRPWSGKVFILEDDTRLQVLRAQRPAWDDFATESIASQQARAGYVD